jgi:hypothetical protein
VALCGPRCRIDPGPDTDVRRASARGVGSPTIQGLLTTPGAMVAAPTGRRHSNQAELEAFAAANVSRAMRLAVIPAVRAVLPTSAVAKAPS